MKLEVTRTFIADEAQSIAQEYEIDNLIYASSGIFSKLNDQLDKTSMSSLFNMLLKFDLLA